LPSVRAFGARQNSESESIKINTRTNLHQPAITKNHFHFFPSPSQHPSTKPKSTTTMLSIIGKTSSLLLSMGAISFPKTSAFITPAQTSRVNRLHFYVSEDGGYGGGYPGEYPVDSQYGPPAPEFQAMVYDHAVECANYPGMCDLDELMGLAGGKI
jgi:hypothetical protein